MRTAIFCALLAAVLALPAAEGMFPLDAVTPALAAEMKAMGCRFDPAGLWRPGEKCLAMAVVNLGGGTGSFVSADGLIITNHHVVFGAVQSLSSLERNYIRDGFLAAGREQEIPAPGYSVRVMTGFEDVSDRFRRALRPGLDPLKRLRLVERISRELAAEGEKVPGSECAVVPFHGGRQHYRVTYLKLRDMRVVYVPARAVGEYGGEVDNWMWPRHTGDFSFLRAYVGRDGRPADYAPANVPFRPLHHFPVARTPLREGDFTAIMGYPATTRRWLTAAEAANEAQVAFPARIALLERYIALLERLSAADEAVRIKNAGVLKGLYNSIKNNRGLLAGLERDAVLASKAADEKELAAWIAVDPARGRRFGRLLGAVQRLAAGEREIIPLETVQARLGRGCRLLEWALTLSKWGREKSRRDLERETGFTDRDMAAWRDRLPVNQRNLDLQTDAAVFALYLESLLAADTPGTFAALAREVDSAPGAGRAERIAAYAAALYAGTRLAGLAFKQELLRADAGVIRSCRDPFLLLAGKLQPGIDALNRRRGAVAGEWLEWKPLYVEALAAMHPQRLRPPDANRTLRFSYGRVEGYSPRDAVRYAPFTTLAGVLAKERGEAPFELTPAFRSAALEPGLSGLPVNFLTSNDSTGGNSGSPVLNADGELVGVLFDGNYESLASDFRFRPELTRSIHVDMRYVRFVAERVDRAGAVLRELGLE
jgi:hypothetical protein